MTIQRHTVIRKNTFNKQCFSSSRRQIKQRLLAIEHANLISMLNCLYLVTIMYYSSIIYLYLESLCSGHFCLFQNVCYTHLELRHWVVYQRFYRVVLIIKLCIDYFCYHNLQAFSILFIFVFFMNFYVNICSCFFLSKSVITCILTVSVTTFQVFLSFA